jgi:hypothetical protein
LVRQAKVLTPQVVLNGGSELHTLGEESSLGALGLVEVKLTPAEEAVLSRPINVDDVMMKPTGQPYLSHPSYTRWFNDAFGRLGWAIVPTAKPMKAERSVVCPYMLYIHGQPVAFAHGEQDYHENNKEQTYGDALEATVASALRRCAKRLGVGLELWDKRFLNAFIATECVKVKLAPRQEGDKPAWVWRRKNDPPFWNELSRGVRSPEEREADDHQPQRRSAPPAPAAHHDAYGESVISEKQLGRMIAIAKSADRTDTEVKMWLKIVYGIDSKKQVKRKDYEAICTAIEHPGPLPLPGAEG